VITPLRYGAKTPFVKGVDMSSGRGERSADVKGRRPRADAVRNRSRILDAAEQVFVARGATFSTAQVARAAGVGIGTVFRHFPTKETLLEALVVARLAELTEEADAELRAGRQDGLFRFLERLVEQSAQKRAVFEALGAAGVNVKALMATAGSDLRAALGRLLAQARRAKVVREDVGIGEILGLTAGMAHAAEQGAWDRGMQRRIVTLMFDGLRRR
jgi:AcrR family transcriptional regulator